MNLNLRKLRSNYVILFILYIFLLPIAIVHASTNIQNNKSPFFYTYQTPTRFIIITTNSKDCDNDPSVCSSVLYYEINKKTGESLKLKGNSINKGQVMDFKGYEFNNPKTNYYYRILFQNKHTFEIIDLKNNKLIVHEKIQG